MWLDSENIRTILEEQFPSLGAERIALLGAGYDSVAFDVDDTWVFRFPKRADVEHQLLRELRVLPAIAGRVPVVIPEYHFLGKPSPRFPRHFGGYRKVPGTPAHLSSLSPAQLAHVAPQMGRFLSVLHGCDLPGIRADLPVRSARMVLEDVQGEALDDLYNLNEVSPPGLVSRWRAYLERAPVPASASGVAVIVHGDLAAEHVLVDEDTARVTGVIDWSEIARSSAALDLAALYHWGGERFAAHALRHYQHTVTAELLREAKYIAVCRAILDVTFGLETGRAEYIDGALRTLNGPVNASAD